MLTKVFRLDPDDRPPLKAVCLKGAKVAMIKTHVSNDAGPGTRGAWEKAGALLEGAGAVVEDVELPEVFKRCHEWQDIIVSSEVRVAFLSSTWPLAAPPRSRMVLVRVVLRGVGMVQQST
ncbi:hypothetical protein DCS_00289 [Drechmeria coniospora]|uniref:Uncharacterized protein n=1 Tax=Drechmeria coniospora TaxID=98403 RepID=A0A151GPX7_DRECN|nr:hypothetical protein DCS_00289 [Drechmeria coniospora]KYK59159.1 hypothetical protein DCS_00289 [Drechmeria coniospora]